MARSKATVGDSDETEIKLRANAPVLNYSVDQSSCIGEAGLLGELQFPHKQA
jgi:hypothetical protein